MLLSAKLLACRCGLHSLEGLSFGSVRAARLQDLTPKQESLGGKLIAGEARHCGREANRGFFSVFASTTNESRCQMQRPN